MRGPQWTPEEDDVLTQAVRGLGVRWDAIAERLPLRTLRAARARWEELCCRSTHKVSPATFTWPIGVNPRPEPSQLM